MKLRKQISENFFGVRVQTGRELDLDLHDEVAALTGLLGNDHSQAGIPLLVPGLCWPGFRYADGFAVDRFHNALPACESFLETEFDACDKVVALASEGRMWYLSRMLVRGFKWV